MTNPSFVLQTPKNNSVAGQLLGAIGASDTTIALKVGHGNLYFPSITRNTCSSTGNARTLNSTGNLASLGVGDFIENLTDGSWGVVIDVSGSPNNIRTTPLEGGSLNVWTNANVWVKGAFVATLVQYAADGVTVSKRERIRVTNRVGDSLTVIRGYDGDTAQAFNANDYVQILVEENQVENLQQAVRNILGKIDYIHRGQDSYAVTTGSANAYALTISPPVTSLADIAGKPIFFKTNFGITGAATLNLNGLGAISITKMDGVTALVSGDIANGQLVGVMYNGTSFQMLTPIGQAGAVPIVGAFFGDGSDGAYTLDGTQAAVAGLFSKSSNTYTLLRDAYFTDLTITSSPAVTLFLAGFRLFVSGTLTLNGTISTAGAAGSNGTAAADANGSGGGAGGPGAPVPAAGFFKALGGAAGGGGGTGFNPPAASAGTVGGTGTSVTNSFGSGGAPGGAGGAGASGPGGGGSGPGGTVTNPPAAGGTLRNIFQAALGKVLLDGGNSVVPYWGAGAGGGGGGGGSGPPGGGGGGGGGGGASAWPMYVAAKIVTGNGSFDGRGGAGGAGARGGNGTNSGGGAGGGGGGHGALFIFIYNDNSGFSGTTLLTGGAAGTFGTGANSGSAGTAGTNGTQLSFRVQ